MPRNDRMIWQGGLAAVILTLGGCTGGVDERRSGSVYSADYAELGSCLQARIEAQKDLCPHDLAYRHNEDAGAITLGCTSDATGWDRGGTRVRLYRMTIEDEGDGQAAVIFTSYADMLAAPNYRRRMLPEIQQCVQSQVADRG